MISLNDVGTVTSTKELHFLNTPSSIVALSPITTDKTLDCSNAWYKTFALLEIVKYLKENYPDLKIRINTNGHANAIHKKNVAALLAPYIDTISISLNAQNEEIYNKISNPKIENAYEEVKRFIRACVEEKIKTYATVVVNVPNYPVDKDRCEIITKSLGAKFRARDFIPNGY